MDSYYISLRNPINEKSLKSLTVKNITKEAAIKLNDGDLVYVEGELYECEKFLGITCYMNPDKIWKASLDPNCPVKLIEVE